MSWRCLVWVQSLLGSGHLRRAMLLADTLAARGVEVVLANGGPPGPWPSAEGVSLVQLPVLVAKDTSFSGLVDGTGRSPDDALRDIAAVGRDTVIVAHKGILRASLVLTCGWDMLGKAPVRYEPERALIHRIDASGAIVFEAAIPLAVGR